MPACRPTRCATPSARRVGISFAIEQGQRAYVERIDIHGNTRTRGYVIRREFDIAEGDAFNKGLIDRAERRLKNLDYFKTVKITTKPGSASDRVILDVELQEKDTGDFNIAGGYSTTDGWLAELKLGDRNFAGTGVALNSSFNYGQYARGFDVSATDPGFFGNRASGGIDLSAKETDTSPYQSYGTVNYGATMLVGTPISEQLGMRSSAIRSRGGTSRWIRLRSQPRPRSGAGGGRDRAAIGVGGRRHRRPIRPSIIRRRRPRASARNCARISPASAATSASCARRKISIITTRSTTTWWRLPARKAVTSPMRQPSAADRQLLRWPVDGARFCAV